MIPPQVVASVMGVAGVVCVVIGMAIAAAGKRRLRLTSALERRVGEVASALESLTTASRGREERLDARLTRLEQMIDTLAVETERIGEGQRHVSKLLVSRETPGETEKRR